MTHERLIIANWKMHGSLAFVHKFAATLRPHLAALPTTLTIGVAPPAVWLRDALQAFGDSRVQCGAQNCHHEATGAYTGSIAAPMLAEAGARFVIIGHSERRLACGDNAPLIRKKISAAHAAGLRALVCIGESFNENRQGMTHSVISEQISSDLPDDCTPANTVVSYEPVWAIGTGVTPTPTQIATTLALIQEKLRQRFWTNLSFPLLYGGSVTPENAAELLGISGCDGLLVGGASLHADRFAAILAAAA